MVIPSAEGQRPGLPSRECQNLTSRHLAGGDPTPTRFISNIQGRSELLSPSAFKTISYQTLPASNEHQPASTWEGHVTTAWQAWLHGEHFTCLTVGYSGGNNPLGQGQRHKDQCLRQWNISNRDRGGKHSSVFLCSIIHC